MKSLNLKHFWLEAIALLFSAVFTFPIFIIVHQQLQTSTWPFNLDRILIFAFILLILFTVLRKIKHLIFYALFAVIGWLTLSFIKNDYGPVSLYKDYRALLFAMSESPHPADILLQQTNLNMGQRIIRQVDFTNPTVRNFAIDCINSNFVSYQKTEHQYRREIQCFAIFKEVNDNWNYVNDPVSRDYFARASESVKLMAGDCDDYSILMAASIKAVGGTPRLIITKGHIYPELYIGNDNDVERINYLIKKQLFPDEKSGEGINYHKDAQGRVWLNMDYTARYPGGKFMADTILSVLYP